MRRRLENPLAAGLVTLSCALGASGCGAMLTSRTYPVPSTRPTVDVVEKVRAKLPPVSAQRVQLLQEREAAGAAEDALRIGTLELHDEVGRCVEGHGCRRWRGRDLMPDVLSRAARLGSNLVVWAEHAEERPLKAKRRCHIETERISPKWIETFGGRMLYSKQERCTSYYTGSRALRRIEAKLFRTGDDPKGRPVRKVAAALEVLESESSETAARLFAANPGLGRVHVPRDRTLRASGPLLLVLTSQPRYAEAFTVALDAGDWDFSGGDRDLGAEVLARVVSRADSPPGSGITRTSAGRYADHAHYALRVARALLERGVSVEQVTCQSIELMSYMIRSSPRAAKHLEALRALLERSGLRCPAAR